MEYSPTRRSEMSKFRNIVSTTTYDSTVEQEMVNSMLDPPANEGTLHSNSSSFSEPSSRDPPLLAKLELSSTTAIQHVDTATANFTTDATEFQVLRERYIKNVGYLPQKIQIHRLEQDIAARNAELQKSLSVIASATLDIIEFEKRQRALSKGIDSKLPGLLTEEERIKQRLDGPEEFPHTRDAISTYSDALELTMEKGDVLRNALEFSRLEQDIKNRKEEVEVEREKAAIARVAIAEVKSNSLSLKAEIKNGFHSLTLQPNAQSLTDMKTLFECAISIFLHRIVAMMNLMDELPQSEQASTSVELRHKRSMSTFDRLRYDFLRRHIEKYYKESQKREEQHEIEIADLKQQLEDSRQEMQDKLAEQQATFEQKKKGLKSLLLDAKEILDNRGTRLESAQEDIATLENQVLEMKHLYMVGYKVRAQKMETLRADKLGVSVDVDIVEAGQKACHDADAVADALAMLHRTSTPSTEEISEYGTTYGGFEPCFIRKMDYQKQSMLIDVTNWWSDMSVWFHPDTVSLASFNTSRMTFANSLRRYKSSHQTNKCIRENAEMLAQYQLMKRKHRHATILWRKSSVEEVRGTKITKKRERHSWKKLSESDRKLLETNNEYYEVNYDDDDDDDGGDLEFFKSEKRDLDHKEMFGCDGM
jgi:hypothetical protein